MPHSVYKPAIIAMFTNVHDIPYPESISEYDKEQQRRKKTLSSRQNNKNPTQPPQRQPSFLGNRQSAQNNEPSSLTVLQLSDNDIEDFLSQINHYRKIHGSPPLSYDKKMNDHVIKRAQELLICGEQPGEKKSNDSAYGEICYIDTNFKSNKPNMRELVDGWYADKSHYAHLYMSEPSLLDLSAFERFTQMIWKRSKFVALAIVSNATKTAIVARYDPPGNEFGWFGLNVQCAYKKLPNKSSK